MIFAQEVFSKDLVLVHAYARELGFRLYNRTDVSFKVFTRFGFNSICDIDIYDNISSKCYVRYSKYMPRLIKLISFIEENFDKKDGLKMEIDFN